MVKTGNNFLASLVGYLMVASVAIRAIAAYPAVRGPMIVLLALFTALVLLERPAFRLPDWGFGIYIALQVILMVLLFIVEPDGDFFAILLLPTCVFVMRRYSPRVGWAWVAVFVVAMSIMLVYGHDIYSPQYIIMYIAAYLLIGSYALMLHQTEDARRESQTLLHQLREANQQLQATVEQAEELAAIKERNRLARDLHDSVTQTIFSMTLITKATLILQERAPDQVGAKLTQLQDLAQSALREMRALITQLRPLSVAEDGLVAVLERHMSDLNRRGDLTIALVTEGDSLPLDASQQQELFRIIQEALNNIVKHAGAKEASVTVEVSPAQVCVAIRDDGRGFDPARPNHDRSHIGLDSMRERAKELGGTLDIQSTPGAGTEVMVTVPITREEETRG